VAYPLEGIKVLDLTRVLSGPFATRILSDLGADVVKVEPPRGDLTRAYGSRIGNISSHYTQHNAGKRNVCIDLGAEGAPELVRELADQADVVAENFRPGVMARYGLDWDTLHARNPRMVMLSISGFGQHGPERDRPAYAPVLHAETGLIDRFADIHGNRAVDFPLSTADTAASVHGVIGLLSALLMAQRTGRGQHIDLAMVNAQFYNDDYLSMVMAGDDPPAGGGEVWDIPGGRIIIAAALRYLWRLIAEREGFEDPGDEAGRRAVLTDHFAAMPTWEAVTGLLDELNIPWGRVRPWQDAVFQSPSLEGRELLTSIDERAGGTRPVTQSPYRFSDAESGVRGPAPYRGEHNAEVLADWLGHSSDAVAALADAGVLLEQERP
jgi:CoA:oxalate CoA-transferase